MNPGTTSESRIKILATNGDGVDWYHTHKHGFVSDQVYGGLAGMLQVGDPLDPWPQYKGKYQERLLGLTTGIINTDDQAGVSSGMPLRASTPPVSRTRTRPRMARAGRST